MNIFLLSDMNNVSRSCCIIVIYLIGIALERSIKLWSFAIKLICII